MKTQRDEKTVDLAQLLLNLDVEASVNLKGSNDNYYVAVTVEVNEDGVRAHMVDIHGQKPLLSCKTSWPFSKRLRWTRKRQIDDIKQQMRTLDLRSLLFLRFVRYLTLQDDALSGERGKTKYWLRKANWRRKEDSQCVELCTTTLVGQHHRKGRRFANPQTSNNTARFYVIEEPTLESGPSNRFIMAFPICQYGVGQWTKDEDSFSFTHKKPSPFKFLMHADRWGAPSHTKSPCRIHQDHKMTDFHTRAMAKGFKKLSEIPSLQYTWMQYLPSMDILQRYDALQGGGVCTTLPRWLSLLPILETENDPGRNQLHAITDLRLSVEEELDPASKDLVPDVASAPLMFPISQNPRSRPPSPRVTRRRSSNHPAAADPTTSTITVPLSSKYRRSDLETLMRDYALNLLSEATVTSHLQSLLRESKSATWYTKFFFLRPEYEALHSRIARFLLLAYTKRVESPGFQATHHDGCRKLIESMPFIPLASGKLLSLEESKRCAVHAPEDTKRWPLVDPGMDLKQLPIQVVHPGAWNNQDCRKLFDVVGWIKPIGHQERMRLVAKAEQEEIQRVPFGGGLLVSRRVISNTAWGFGS
ncbi:hypothetical protein QBC36DRAFT_235022 [Triangularia setosa]|uniref:Uncharacterized protein n=1 Tax=Triangularia setosa TaxID=2587417 RepID=A0AAN7A7G7_9PEZI|nr:hypothetical protein QBC36DRAFT_235022 [Podospora setosa]